MYFFGLLWPSSKYKDFFENTWMHFSSFKLIGGRTRTATWCSNWKKNDECPVNNCAFPNFPNQFILMRRLVFQSIISGLTIKRSSPTWTGFADDELLPLLDEWLLVILPRIIIQSKHLENTNYFGEKTVFPMNLYEFDRWNRSKF